MFIVKAGQVNNIPLPSRQHDEQPSDIPSAIQLLGVLKMRKPFNFDLQSIGSVKRAAASEGGASSGGYLLSSLALDPHSLIISSTAPIILSQHDNIQSSTFNVFIPADAIPSYKGDSFDVEYVVVEKRLSDGHLEMMMVLVKSGVSLNDSQCRILYSRDCPAVVCDHHLVTIADVERRLRLNLEIDAQILKVLQVLSIGRTDDNHQNNLQFAIKDNDDCEVAIIKVLLDKSIVESIVIQPQTTASNIHVEVLRIEAIDDLFSTSDSGAVKQKLIYRRLYDNIDFAGEVLVEHLPEMCLISTPIFKVYYSLQLVIDDAFSCAIHIR